MPLRLPTSDPVQLVRVALQGLRAIYYCEGFSFANEGIRLLEFEPPRAEQKELPLDESPDGRDEFHD